ncbi:hypothetical protein SCP_1900910 [Sparassis crispa]|uniref:Uncharacterized protein n=1 Tax=Sparassis crispa TaxID=139825 RepID=A0A401H760_9APHY|nr:hypothetical protein SCP_1900910 [Sparassis crispa]GBE90242.1 hypothetical protein SCP_1900910 [Sparassis crispa]
MDISVEDERLSPIPVAGSSVDSNEESKGGEARRLPPDELGRVAKNMEPREAAYEIQFSAVTTQIRIIRHTPLKYRWFHSTGSHPVKFPPEFPPQASVDAYDVYTHSWPSGVAPRGMTQQMWIWKQHLHNSSAAWLPVSVGYYCETGRFTGRSLVLTDQGVPSWVGKLTLQRGYKHVGTGLDDGANPVQPGDASKGKSKMA